MISILLIDDHEVVRIGLKQMASDAFTTVTCEGAPTSQEAIRLAPQRDWDLIILELSLGGDSGLEILKELKRIVPKIPVLVFTRYSEGEFAPRAIRAGAAGYITKVSPASEVVKAIKQTLHGGRYVSASLAERLSADLQRKSSEAIHETLSDREFQVMRLLGSAKTVGQIALLLSISDKTVSTYRARILEKTGLRNNAELIRYVIEHGFVD